MTFAGTLITALIAGGFAFLLGWVVCKAVLSNDLAAEPEQAGNQEPVSDDFTTEPDAEINDEERERLQLELRAAHQAKAEAAAKNSIFQERIDEQTQMLANLQEDRDRIRVEHGSQKRLINSLQQKVLAKDKWRQQFIKEQEEHQLQIDTLTAENKKLSEQLQTQTTDADSGNAPVPTQVGSTDAGELRKLLEQSRSNEKSLVSQLQTLQEWAKPLATENTQQGELINRLKHQIAALRKEQKAAEDKLAKLSGAIRKAKAAQQQRAAALAEQQASQTGVHDNVISPAKAEYLQAQTPQTGDKLEETHTDLQSLNNANADALTNVQQDDLKKIKGIGPGVEKRFHKAGIFSYHQLARLNQDQIAKIAARTNKAHRAAWAIEAQRLLEAGETAA